MIEIGKTLSIPESEISFTVSRSSGPGGQHVNKVSTRVTLQFDLRNSLHLSDRQKRRLATRLASRINRDGVLKLHCQRHRSQAANREELIRRFAALLRDALTRRRKRIATRPTRSSVERRLTEKQRRGRIKQDRKRGEAQEE
jgi:ribosome-associated protein